MSNFINEAVLGKAIAQGSFLEELTDNPIIKIVLFVGSISVAGYFTLRFWREIVALLPKPKHL